ncbi:MAG TPA: hypothetical protein VHI78_02450 [Bacteroidales bacterium]|jgi:hypothetical protein|nr:hypothetical protein [Bacteroidales bacterium]
MNSLAGLPDERQLLSAFPAIDVLNVNGHIHTPYSFSAFGSIPEIFGMAVKENISCLGINDFFVADGYDSFHDGAVSNGILPLFNIEFIGLMKEEQRSGLRINDPNNPGRCYFCGKGLDYPFHVNAYLSRKLENVIRLSQEQVKAMIEKMNDVFYDLGSDIRFNYEEIRARLSKNLVRERHLAKSVRMSIFERYPETDSRIQFMSKLFGGKTIESSITDIPALENEIRANLLKSGGRAFVEEDDNTFLSINEIIEIILDAGGIPCYPVLLDDKKGNYTEFESSPEMLLNELKKRNINCIELIPGRNDALHLEKFVNFFDKNGFLILMGSEHNTPEMIPLTCDTRGKRPLTFDMKRISYEGACIVAAHQYLRAKGGKGYINENGHAQTSENRYYIMLGNAIIHYHSQKHPQI